MLEIHTVDAFSSTPFCGNPAAVCVLREPADAGWMQQMAAELNLSETAFLLAGEDAFGLRWFTPTVEVTLCGHATLASAHVLWELGHVAVGRPVAFDTLSGRLSARSCAEGIELDFPTRHSEPMQAPGPLLQALGIGTAEVRSDGEDALVIVADAEVVRGLHPDMAALCQVGVRGAVVTAPGDTPGIDFVSRFFAPAAGVPEDPVTGSAHCLSGPYWAKRLTRPRLRARQLSRRGGELRVEVRGERVGLVGSAVTVMRSSWLGGFTPACG